MISKTSNTADLSWLSSLEELHSGKKPSPVISKILDSGIKTLLDLLWILPLRIHKMPPPRPFSEAVLNQYFKGSGKVIHVEIKPAFGRRGKGNILLYNGFVVVKDDLSGETLSLRWFNLYPNQKKMIETLERIEFLGQVQEFKAQKQVINPQIISEGGAVSPYIIDYPTINKLSGTYFKKVIDLIPQDLWDSVPQMLPELGYDSKLSLGQAFKIIHGKLPSEQFDLRKKDAAEERLIYEEFLLDQLRIQTRRKFIKRKAAPVYEVTAGRRATLLQELPYELTTDQLKVFEDILLDLKSGHPMMRMVQGDVGCGKTIVAYLASRVVGDHQSQVALMCPTEALAIQHFESFKALSSAQGLDLLLGSTKAKEKKLILARLISGETKIVIGTHALFQDTVRFKNLGLAVIDEQHKFGVEQRLRLVAKGAGTHSLIMTATPIPRTLSLAQYGDLDISSIRMMPAGRKGIKTRITEKVNYGKYVEFVKTRLGLGEQAYFVFPAIDESETADLQNVKDSLKKYKETFKGLIVEMLHGQMKTEEKERVVQQFRDKLIHILVSTSVVEVGINIPNATIMSIYNPERFGLSSLHQLRGRVGRGERPGFCFLVLDKEPSPEAQQRLQVVETNLDGFVIAEEDLKFRGEGDLFGVDQSGSVASKKLANFITHTAILEQVVRDLKRLDTEHPELLGPHFERLAKDQKILDTI
ncbi:MAG TPA: ATP-dependent DNA helicase RecG [Bacteriovoracaceae bacterium]|nr:ATP-dependent DNA helicase RecG [Bacteriovoracaceae bacterium]